MDFPHSSVSKGSTCNVGDPSLIPGLGRSPGEGKGYPLQYSGLENSMDCIVHGVAKSQTGLSDFHFTSYIYLGFPGGSDGKVSTSKSGDLVLIPGLERSPGEGKGYPLWYSGLENSVDCIVHGVAKSWTRLSNFHVTSFICYPNTVTCL